MIFSADHSSLRCPPSASPHEALRVSALRPAVVFREHALRALRPRAGLSAGSCAADALTAKDGQRWHSSAVPGQTFRFCANAAHDACNWLVPADGAQRFCRACQLNRMIPHLETPGNLLRWQRLEAAKHRLVYGLLRFGLPLASRAEDPQAGLAFDFLADSGPAFRENPQAMTGHSQGLITINVAEADDAERERHARTWPSPTARCSGISATRSGTTTGSGWCAGAPGWSRFARCSATSARTTAPAWSGTTPPARGPTGRSASSAPTPACTRGRTGRRPGRTTCTSSIRWRPRPPSACACSPAPGAMSALAMTADFDPYGEGDFAALVAGLAAAHLRAQQSQPEHGPGGLLSVRPGAAGHGEAALHPRRHPPQQYPRIELTPPRAVRRPARRH